MYVLFGAFLFGEYALFVREGPDVGADRGGGPLFETVVRHSGSQEVEHKAS